MSQKLDRQEEESRSKYVLELKSRSRSSPILTSDLTRELLFDNSKQLEDGVFIF